jgi:probable rRNA maturation factor
LLTKDEHIRILNRDYRGADTPTDVLSFSLLEAEDVLPDGSGNVLGDVVISVETARRQAEERGEAVEKEIDILLTHGVLHLLGYDHTDKSGEDRMFARQAELLDKFWSADLGEQ